MIKQSDCYSENLRRRDEFVKDEVDYLNTDIFLSVNRKIDNLTLDDPIDDVFHV